MTEETKEIANLAAALEAKRQALLGTPAPFGDDSKRAELAELSTQLAALFARKREMSAARYTKNNY